MPGGSKTLWQKKNIKFVNDEEFFQTYFDLYNYNFIFLM
jgi:hypothetical protein